MADPEQTTRKEQGCPVLDGTSEKTSARYINVVDLMAGRSEVVLMHAGAEYLLRITSNGRLILTK
ncbi:MAG: hemin uptake protein HemP [Pseudomonadota bacterium]